MPRSKKVVARPTKKYRYKRRRKKGASNPYNLGVLVPSTKKIKLRYSTNLAFGSLSGIINKNQFNVGSIHDPDYTGAGHQPFGYDQLAALYKQYVVLGAKVTAKFRQASANNIPHHVGAWLDRDLSISESSLSAISEKSKNRRNFSILATNSNATTSVVCYYSLKGFYSETDAMNDHRYIGEFGSSPSNWPVINVAVQPVDQSSTSSVSLWAEIEIEFMVECRQPLELTQS